MVLELIVSAAESRLGAQEASPTRLLRQILQQCAILTLCVELYCRVSTKEITAVL